MVITIILAHGAELGFPEGVKLKVNCKVWGCRERCGSV